MNAATPTALCAAHPRCRGLTLVEILVALLILSIGLLGLAGLQTLSLKFNTGAYYRTQATALAYSMADRMRANRVAALDGKYTVAFAAPPDCGTPATDGAVPANDIAAWQMALACRLPQGQGSVALIGDDEFTFTVRWNDSKDKSAPMEFQFTTSL